MAKDKTILKETNNGPGYTVYAKTEKERQL